jgi:hypothetical protein
LDELAKIETQDSASRNGYKRDQFGSGWAIWGKCDTRQRILARDLANVALDDDGCTVLSGTLHDPYTGKIIEFQRGSTTSSAVQIDHVVALADAWQTGAFEFESAMRTTLANDDLELLAVDGPANAQKGAGNASTWLPSNRAFRCSYVARQIAIKRKYNLWVTADERTAMTSVLNRCPDQRLPSP